MRRRLLPLLALCLVPATAHGAAGDLDPSFGTGGRATGPEQWSLTTSSLAVGDDGRFVVNGKAAPADMAASQLSFVRFRGDGALDADFGFGGAVLLPARDGVFSGGVALPAADAATLSVGLAADSSPPAYFGTTARIDSFGAGDSGFGAGGLVTYPTPDDRLAAPRDALYLPGGNVAAAVYYTDLSTMVRAAIFTYSATTGEKLAHNLFPGRVGANSDARAIVRTPDGKLVVAGISGGSGIAPHIFLARARADTLEGDMTFGIEASWEERFGMSDIEVDGLAVQPDGKLVVAGSAGNATGGRDVFVARFAENGPADMAFGEAGVRRLELGADNGKATDVVRQPDGKLLVFGRLRAGSGNDQWFAARLDGSGALDASYGTGGIARVAMPSAVTEPTAGALLTDGRLLITGWGETTFPKSQVLAVRLQGDDTSAGGGGETTSTPTGGTVPSDGSAAPPCINCSGRPGATGAGPVLRIRGGRVTGRKARFRVTCPAGTGRCRGRLVLFVRPGTSVPARAADTRRLGAARLRIRAGRTKRVKVRIPRSVARGIRAGAPLPALAIATARDAAGNAGTTRANVMLRR